MTELHPSTFPDCIIKIRECAFECEAGPLTNLVQWQWLEAMAKVCPEYLPGQGVWFEIEAEAAGKKLRQWVHFYIVGCRMKSDTENRLWTYSLSCDPPAPWRAGTVHFTGIAEGKLSLVKPEQEHRMMPGIKHDAAAIIRLHDKRTYVAISPRREYRDVELQARAVEMKRVRGIEASGFEVVG